MGPGFKYHLVTVSAIFFALTVGLVIGSVFVSPRFARKQENAISKLQDTLNNDIARQRIELQQYQQCVLSLLPLASRGKLTNSAVAVIQVGEISATVAFADDAVALISPRSLIHVTLTQACNQTDEDIARSLRESSGDNVPFPTDRQGLMDAIAAQLAHGGSVDSGDLAALERRGYLRATSDDQVMQPIRYAVLVTGSRTPNSSHVRLVDIPLARALAHHGIAVVACEQSDAPLSDIPSYQQLNPTLSTVDCIDRDIGRCALLLAFNRHPGNFGIKRTATSLLPDTNGTADGR